MKVQNKRKIVFGIIVGLIFGITITVITSYAVAATLIKSADVSYIDNSNLKATNVQAAIDGTCTKFSNDLATLLDKMYPIGSIYISTSLSTPAQVGSAIGGTWEAYGKGQTLVGVDTSQTEFDKISKTGGAKSVSTTLKETNLPSHSHVIPALTGIANQEGSAHSHILGARNDSFGAPGVANGFVLTQADHMIDYANFVNSNITGTHTHTVTTNPSATTTCTNCNAQAFSTSTLQPYITVYMYKRTK